MRWFILLVFVGSCAGFVEKALRTWPIDFGTLFPGIGALLIGIYIFVDLGRMERERNRL